MFILLIVDPDARKTEHFECASEEELRHYLRYAEEQTEESIVDTLLREGSFYHLVNDNSRVYVLLGASITITKSFTSSSDVIEWV